MFENRSRRACVSSRPRHVWTCPACGKEQSSQWIGPQTTASRLCNGCHDALVPMATRRALHSTLTLEQAMEQLAEALEQQGVADVPAM